MAAVPGTVTYIVFLLGPVQPVLPLWILLTAVPKPVFDGKLKEGRTTFTQNELLHQENIFQSNHLSWENAFGRKTKYKMVKTNIMGTPGGYN